jgi:hypothetical protein
MDLFSKKFTKNITVLDAINIKSITNINTGAFFSILDNECFVFRDEDNNFWTTVTKEYRVNEEVFYPYQGMVITFGDNTTHMFTTEEEITELAIAYFENFIIAPPVITTEVFSLLHYDGVQYKAHYKTFKAKPHDDINITYSCN